MTSIIFYMVVYLFMTLGAFYLVGVVERETGRTDIDAFEGLGFKAPVLGATMTIFLLSLTGIPPTGGFVGKLFIFKEVFAYAGAAESSLFFWGGVIGLLNSVIALGYYSKFLRVMYLADMDRVSKEAFRFPDIDKGMVLALALPVLVLGVAFADLYDLALGFALEVF